MKIAGIKLGLGTWDLWRMTRMGIGILSLVIGIVQSDIILGLAGVVLIAHAYYNACVACQTGACEVPETKKK
jgi:hypothetical protein